MFKLSISVVCGLEEIPEKVLYIENLESLKKYLEKTFPYHENKEVFEDILGDYFSMSFYIRKDNMAIYSIDIEYLEMYDESVKNYAYGGGCSIFEIFGEDSYLIELEFTKYKNNMEIRECCTDSWRIGRLDCENSMKEYWTYETCCGSDNTEIVINNKKYMFGCNYGH